MEKNEAKNLVIRAGHELVAEGLIARTWGNISCRISDEEFVITPSGKSYEDLVPSEIVPVRIDDCSWSGTVRPSSEKAVHSALYRLHPEANFIIHTHQYYATAIGATGRSLRGYDAFYREVLGRCVPCAEYGISTTQPLADAVEAAAALYPEAQAILMRNHGVVCIGVDYESAFNAARKLEELCRIKYSDLTGLTDLPENFIPGTPAAAGKVHYREVGGRTYAFLKSPFVRRLAQAGGADESAENGSDLFSKMSRPFGGGAGPLGGAADGKPGMAGRVVKHPLGSRLAPLGKSLPAYIDDCAQMAGASIRVLPAEASGSDMARALMHAPMVFVRNKGAVCVGADREEADAACMVLEKNAMAAYVCRLLDEGKPVGGAAAMAENLIYRFKYSKLKNS